MKKTCFVISPIGDENGAERKHANEVMGRIIEPVTREFGYEVIRADQYPVPGQITSQIVNLIVESNLVIADLSFGNPNVFYELALRHITLKSFIHLVEKKYKIPFDIKDIRAISFDLGNEKSIEQAKSELREQIENIEEAEKYKGKKRGPETIQYISTLLGRLEIIFPALQFFAREGKSEDKSNGKFRRMFYKDKIIANLDLSDNIGDELELRNVNAIRIDASGVKIGTFRIKNSIINLLDISGCEVKRLIVEDTKIAIMDASESKINVFVRKGVEFANPPDFSGAEVLEEIEK